MLTIKDRRKVAYIATQNEEPEAIVASIKGAVSAVQAGAAPYGVLYVVTLSGDEVEKSQTAPITIAARICGDTNDIELTTGVGIPIYLVAYLRMSQN